MGLSELGAHDAAVRLGHHGLRRNPGLTQRFLQRGQVLLDPWLHIAVDHRRGGALVFADHRPHVARAEHREPRGYAVHDRLHRMLMRRIAIGIDEGDHDALGAKRPRLLHGGDHARLIDGRLYAAVGGDPLLYREHAIPGDQRRRSAREEVPRIGRLQARELQHVAKVLGGEQAELYALALDHGVHADGGAMREIGNAAGLDAVACLELAHPFHHLRARPVRR